MLSSQMDATRDDTLRYARAVSRQRVFDGFSAEMAIPRAELLLSDVVKRHSRCQRRWCVRTAFAFPRIEALLLRWSLF